jgi:hypothetical protein
MKIMDKIAPEPEVERCPNCGHDLSMGVHFCWPFPEKERYKNRKEDGNGYLPEVRDE